MSSHLSNRVSLPDRVALLTTADALKNYTLQPLKQDSATYETLNQLRASDLFPHKVSNDEMAQCCLAGLWLLHNRLDESHEISQQIETPNGSYWHGIMHRLEGDFGNSKYWMSRAGQHPVFDQLNQQLPGGWHYRSFIDACDSSSSSNDLTQLADCQRIAVAEWLALFEYCWTNSGGA